MHILVLHRNSLIRTKHVYAHYIPMSMKLRMRTKSLKATHLGLPNKNKLSEKRWRTCRGFHFWSHQLDGRPPTRSGTNKRVNSERVTTGMAREQNILRKKVEPGHPSLFSGARGFETSWPASPRFASLRKLLLLMLPAQVQSRLVGTCHILEFL